VDARDRDIFGRWMRAACEALGIALQAGQVDLMYRHLNLVLLANEDFNLTRITDPAEAAVKLVADSLAILPWVARRLASGLPGLSGGGLETQALAGKLPVAPTRSGVEISPAQHSVLSTQHPALSTQHPSRVLDIGTGAGYPAVPLAICRPNWTVTAIDPSGKKIRFVARVAAELGLHNLITEQIQAREWHGKVAPFDLVISRAMGDLSTCIREGARLLTPDGCIVSYHGEELTAEEAKAADQMQKRYKLQQMDSFEYTLPGPKKGITRRLIVIGTQKLATQMRG
jgi:16S rRNA (guanine527-N7)-methyltransferase